MLPVEVTNNGRTLLNQTDAPNTLVYDIATTTTYAHATDTFVSGLDLSDDGTKVLTVSSDTVNGSGTFLWNLSPDTYTSLSGGFVSGGRIAGDNLDVMVTDLFSVDKI